MKKEKLRWTPQKYKGSEETTASNYMPIKWTTQKKWTNSQKLQSPKTKQEKIENTNIPITSTEMETVI